MMLAGSPIAATAVASYDDTSHAVLSLFQQLLLDPTLERRFFVRAFPADDATGLESELRYTQIPWESKLAEDFRMRVEEAVNYRSTILSGELANLGGPPSFGAMRVQVDPQAGDTDDFVYFYWDNRRVDVYMGMPDWDVADFQIVQSAQARNIRVDLGGYTIDLQDPSLGLQDPIQSSVYAGTGDPGTPSTFIEGGEDLKDQPRGICYGRPPKITPQQIDRRDDGGTPFLVYQFHDRQSRAVDAVYDQGVALTAHNGGANDITDLALASVWDWDPTGHDGEYITDLSQSLIRLAAPPNGGTITADVQGDDEGGVLADTIPAIVERILRQRAGYTDADLDLPSFALLAVANQQPASLYLQSGTESLLSVVTSLLDDILGFWRFTRVGEFTVGQLRASSPLRTIEAEDVDNLVSPRALLPHKARTLQYARSHTVQDDDTLAGAATDDYASFVAKRYRQVREEASAIAAVRLGAVEQTIETHFDNLADAEAENARQLALLSENRRIWECSTTRQQFLHRPGDTVRIEYPRWGFGAGRNAIVIGVTERSRTLQTELTVWG